MKIEMKGEGWSGLLDKSEASWLLMHISTPIQSEADQPQMARC